MIAIRIRNLSRYFGPSLDIDGAERPGEAWRVLAEIGGVKLPPPAADAHGVQRTVAVAGHVLRDISLDVEQGSVVCLAGPSGSGKSVLLQILAGVLAPTSGTVEIYGPVTAMLRIGGNLESLSTAWENIQASPQYAAAAPEDAARFATEVLEFAELKGFEHAQLRTFSTGMSMRLSVALALCGRPSIVLIDDVLTVGDIGFQQKCIERVHALKAQGATLVAAFSDELLVQQIATRVVTLAGGHVVSDAPPIPAAAAQASQAAEVEWVIHPNLPEDDVMALRAVRVEPGRDGDETFIDLSLGLEPKSAPVKCWPNVFVMSGTTVLFRSISPDILDVADCRPFTCTVRIPISILPNGAYAVAISIPTLVGKMVYSIKSHDAVALRVRRAAGSDDEQLPLFSIPMAWDIERIEQGQA